MISHINDQWLDALKIGDIVYEGGNPARARVVREVTMGKKGLLRCVTFSIRRRSWTGRCFTIVTRTDLKTRCFTPARARVKSFTLLDKMIAHDILYWDKSKQRVRPADVRGIA
jgi:hypothetical protein